MNSRFRNTLLFVVVFICKIVVSQNWQPVSLGNKYHYSISGSVKYATIIADSANASTVYLNRIVTSCDTCWHMRLTNFPYDSTFLWINQGSFLQEKIQKLPGNSFYFSGAKKQVLKLNEALNTYWLYDTASSIHAKIISTGIQTVLGVNDSVKTILVSATDSIVVSKNHGIIQFPLNDVQHTTYRLIGIEGMALGFQMPKFTNFYNFNVGDVFQYQNVNDNYAFFPPQFKRGAEKRTVLSKTVLSNGFKYTMRIIKVDSVWYGNSAPYYIISDSIKTITYSDSSTHFTNLYPKQLVRFNNYFTYTFLDTVVSNVECEVAADHKVIKKMGVTCPYFKANQPNNPYGVAYYSRTIKNLYLGMNSHLVFGRAAKEGLGIISELFNNFDILRQSCLTASVKGRDTTGTLLDDEAILSLNNYTEHTSIQIYPNPVKDFLTVYDETHLGNLYLYNSIGEIVFTYKPTTVSEELTINTETFKNGIYVLVSEKDYQRQYKKIVIQK